MKASEATRKHGRTPGERAFDRCLLPLVALFGFSLINEFFAWRLRFPYKPQMPPLVWPAWLPFTVGLILAALWVRAVVSLVAVWRDPSSRVLRFSASILLIPFAFVTCHLLLTPFTTSPSWTDTP